MSDLVISSPQNPAVKLIRSLTEKKHRQETGLFMAEGEKVLERARREGWGPALPAASGMPAFAGMTGLV